MSGKSQGILRWMISGNPVKALITAAAEDIHKYFLIVFQGKWDLIFHVNLCLAEDSHETSSLIFFER